MVAFVREAAGGAGVVGMTVYAIHRKRGDVAGFDLDVDDGNLRVRSIHAFNNSLEEVYVFQAFKAGVLEFLKERP